MKTKVLCFVSVFAYIVLLVAGDQGVADTNRLPAVVRLVVAGSGTVSEHDVQKAKRTIVWFAERLQARALRRPWACADWLMVRDYDEGGTGVVNCSWEMTSFYTGLREQPLPIFGHGTVSMAVEHAASEVTAIEEKLPGRYVKVVVILWAGGQENDPDTAIADRMPQLSTDGISLFIIDLNTVDVNEIDALLQTLMPQPEASPASACSEQFCVVN